MACAIKEGQRQWSMSRDEEGHRTYKIIHLVIADRTDGPANVLQTPGLPLPGSMWAFDDDFDPWAFCLPNMDIRPLEPPNRPSRYWEVEQTFSTKPTKRCQDETVENPLLEPPKISGGFNKYTEEATHDRFGKKIVNSAHEMIRGPQNEWDANRDTIKITQNVPTIIQAAVLPTLMIDTVNAFPIWGYYPRCVKLSNRTWEQLYHGNCFLYYTRTLEFDTNPNTFDRDLLDEGTKALSGRWAGNEWVDINIGGLPPDPKNPAHFIRFQDRNANNCRVILDGNGRPYIEEDNNILTCAQCPEGASPVWTVSGFNLEDEVTYNGIELAYDAGCKWIGTKRVMRGFDGGFPPIAQFDNYTINLEYVNGAWEVSTPDNADLLYRHQEVVDGPWDCTGENILRRAFDAESTITIRGTGTSQPGEIHVEKYGESNFYLLGVPINF